MWGRRAASLQDAVIRKAEAQSAQGLRPNRRVLRHNRSPNSRTSSNNRNLSNSNNSSRHRGSNHHNHRRSHHPSRN